MSMATTQPAAPLTDAVLSALAKLVDDAQCAKRQPSHSEIQEQFSASVFARRPRTRSATDRKGKAGY